MKTTTDGYVEFKGYRIYYKTVGESKKTEKLPLLILNGGPGSPHNYLLDLGNLADFGRQVIFYDPLGAGLSDKPSDNSLWTIETYLESIETVRKSLELKDIHLLGHSWGGMLAIDYLLSKPKGIYSVVLASTMSSVPLFQKEMSKLRRGLARSARKTLEKHEKAGTTADKEYKDAYQQFSKKHIFRGEDWPTHLNPPLNSYGRAAYEKMWGPSEVLVNGTLKNWDRIDYLQEIKIPVLITSGRFDELTPKQAEITKKHTPNAKQVIFEYSAHMPHIEEPRNYIKTVEEFLESVEQAE